MKDFLLIFRLDKNSEIKPSPEQVKERTEWFSNLMRQNKVSDKGNTLSPIGAKTIHSDESVADCPARPSSRSGTLFGVRAPPDHFLPPYG